MKVILTQTEIAAAVRMFLGKRNISVTPDIRFYESGTGVGDGETEILKLQAIADTKEEEASKPAE